jgi:hypothetical protein
MHPNPYRLFHYSVGPIEWQWSRVKSDLTPKEVPSLACAIKTNKAKYDLVEFQKENFGAPVSFYFLLIQTSIGGNMNHSI